MSYSGRSHGHPPSLLPAELEGFTRTLTRCEKAHLIHQNFASGVFLSGRALEPAVATKTKKGCSAALGCATHLAHISSSKGDPSRFSAT